jgi:hypothetical protein
MPKKKDDTRGMMRASAAQVGVALDAEEARALRLANKLPADRLLRVAQLALRAKGRGLALSLPQLRRIGALVGFRARPGWIVEPGKGERTAWLVVLGEGDLINQVGRTWQPNPATVITTRTPRGLRFRLVDPLVQLSPALRKPMPVADLNRLVARLATAPNRASGDAIRQQILQGFYGRPLARRDLVDVFCASVRAAKESGASSCDTISAFAEALRKIYRSRARARVPTRGER